MRRVLQLPRKIASHFANNPIVRALLALLLFGLSSGSLALTSYADQYVNGGVTWGAPSTPVEQADVNPLGVNLFLEKEVDPAKIDKTLQLTRDAGFKWVRQVFAWNDIEISAKGVYTDARNPGQPVNAWDKYDRIVEQCRRYGLEILARIDSPPDWARIPTDDLQTFHKGPPANNNDFGDFVYAVVSRYKGKVKYFQMWNEPNLTGEWGGHPVSPREYTDLLKVAYARAKEANPEAVVITAALAPTAENSVANLNDVLFLEGMYQEGAAPYFDILSTMLYGLGQPPQDRRVDLNRLSFSRPILLRRVMDRHADTRKPIWISEFAWLSLPPGWEEDCKKEAQTSPCGVNIWGRSVDEETQGQWLVQGYERAQAEWPWMGVMFIWHLRNPDADPRQPATYFEIVRQDFSPRPAYNDIKEYSRRFQAGASGVGPRPVHDKPLWNAWGFPLLYGLFGLLTLSSALFGASSLARWAGAALDRPRGLYTETARGRARNGALVACMGMLVAIYYRANSIPLILVCLGAWGVLAFLKPSAGLAAVAFTIPFFWQPKELGQQRFPIAETLLLLTFLAVLARRLLGRGRLSQAFSKRHLPRFSFKGLSWHDLSSAFRAWSRQDAFAPPAVALLLVGTFSLLTMADPSFARDTARAYRWEIVEPVLFYFLLTDVITGRRGLLRIIDFFVAAAVGIALLGLWQAIFDTNTLPVEGVSRVLGVYQHPNNLALYLGRVLPLAWCLVIFLPRGWRKSLYLLATLPLAATLVLTYSRGAWAGVVVAILTATGIGWWWSARGRARPRLSRLPLVAGAALMLGLGIITITAIPRLPERIRDLGSGTIRLALWNSSLHMLGDHPLFGVGLDQFLNQFQAHYIDPANPQQEAESYTAHPHNLILDYWLSLGIIGVLILLWLLWRYFREAFLLQRFSSGAGADPVTRAIALGLLASMIDFLVHGLIDNSYFLMDLAMIFWLSCGLLQLSRQLETTSAAPGVTGVRQPIAS